MGGRQLTRWKLADLATRTRGGEDAVVRRDHEFGEAVRVDDNHRATGRMREGLRHRGKPALSRPDLHIFDRASGTAIGLDFRVGGRENIVDPPETLIGQDTDITPKAKDTPEIAPGEEDGARPLTAPEHVLLAEVGEVGGDPRVAGGLADGEPAVEAVDLTVARAERADAERLEGLLELLCAGGQTPRSRDRRG